MVDITGLYFVITDGVRARFVRPGPDSRLHSIRLLRHVDPDAANPDQPAVAAVRFAGQLAAIIKEDFAADLFSHLVLVAPQDVLAHLAPLIDGPAGDHLIGRLAEDLMAVPDDELWRHLDAWVRPACRV